MEPCPNCNRSFSCPWCDGTMNLLAKVKAKANLLPDLLEVCKLLAGRMYDAPTGRTVVQMAKAAIVKYEGEK